MKYYLPLPKSNLMPDTTTLTRQELEDKAKHDSDIADLKQHSDKLILGFENSNPTDAKRALWELIQNARDLSSEARIEVTVDSKQFKFTHYGLTFTSKTLLCLIKQVSSKSRKKKEQKEVEEEIKEVGQYGTGFITTHSLGKRFYLDGTIELQPGEYVVLEDFLIDRIAPDSDTLSEKLLSQQNEVFRLIREGVPTNTASPTSFRYQFDDPSEMQNAEIALSENTEKLIPYVMALNNGIKSISISRKEGDRVTKNSYQKTKIETESGLSVISVQKNEEPEIQIYILPVDQELDLKVILPLSSPSKAHLPESSISRLFLYFPLIGTENWGSNFIIHCGLFNPHSERDGIWISSDNRQNSEKEKNNQEILQKASSAIFDFMQKNAGAIYGAINLANISFPTMSGNSHLDNYFKELKAKWVSNFKTYSIVQTVEDARDVQACYFIADELMQLPEYVGSNYDLAAFFFSPLPIKTVSEDWSITIKNWEDPNIKWVTIADINKKIQAASVESVSSELLLPFYEYLLKIGAHRYFEEYKLLPTFSKKFAVKTGLFKSLPLHPLFVEMTKYFAPKVPDQLVNDAFIQSHNFSDYTRNELSKQLNPSIRETISKLKLNTLLKDDARNLLFKFCNSYPSLENKGSRGELMKAILEFYNVNIDPQEIPNLGEDKIDYSAAVECVIKNTVWDFFTRASKEKDWSKSNFTIIKDLLQIITSNKEYSEVISNLPAFLNQNFGFITKEVALIEEGIPHDLKSMYYEIFKKDVNDQLLHDEIVPFLKDTKKLSGDQLALDINKFITEHGPIESINDHPDSGTILKIIQKISDIKNGGVWAKLFQGINAARATIVMATIIKEERKENLFSIITLEDDEKIALLGELAKDESMEKIIAYGRAMLLDKQNSDFDFDLKHKLGKHIEELLRDRLADVMNTQQIEVTVLEEQNGKDIVIKSSDKVIYYLEIKSRWRSDYSIRMSRVQAETAAKNQEDYSLIGINMVGYYPENGERHKPDNLDLIIDRVSVLKDIGTTVFPLLENSLKIGDESQEVHLSPDYAVVIPQVIFHEQGIAFEAFINHLSKHLEEKLKTEKNV